MLKLFLATAPLVTAALIAGPAVAVVGALMTTCRGESQVLIDGTPTIDMIVAPAVILDDSYDPVVERVYLHAEYIAPTHWPLRRGFSVELQLSIQTPPDSPLSPVLPSLYRDVQLGLLVSLEVAGLAVEPKGEVPVSDSLSAKWSARATEGGSYLGVIRMRFAHPSQVLKGHKYYIPEPAEFRVEIEEPRRSLSQILAPFAVVLGLATSMTGLVVFFWRWRDRAKTRTQEQEEKQRPTIYGPDGGAV